jgi:hypothetical protein
MHSSIRIAIVLTLSLIWITQLSFSPVFLSVIFSFELKAFIYPVLPQHASAYPISEL